VEKTLKNALKADKARVTVGKISQFGLLEMSRQRIKPTLEQGIHLECPHCSGRGKVRSTESMALSFLRKVHGSAAKGTVAEVRGSLPLDVAYFLLNRKKRDLAQIEDDYDIEVTVKGKPSFLMNQLEIDLLKRDKPLVPQEPAEEAPVVPLVEEVEEKQPPPNGEAGDGKKKKRRRGKKKPKQEGEQILAAAESREEPEAEVEQAAELQPEEPAVGAVPEVSEALAEHPHEEVKKKRRRRKKRGAKPVAETAAGEGAEEEATEPGQAVPVVAQPDSVAEEALTEEARKKRRRKRRRPKRHEEEAPSAAEPMPGNIPAEPPAPEVERQPDASAPVSDVPSVPGKKPRKPRRPPTKPADTAAAEETRAVEPESPAEAAPPKRSARKKKAAPATEPAPVDEPVSLQEAPPKPKRAPRKKRQEEPTGETE